MDHTTARIDLHVSRNGQLWTRWDSVGAECKQGVQLHSIRPFRPSEYPFVKIEVLRCFGSQQTYLNRLHLHCNRESELKRMMGCTDQLDMLPDESPLLIGVGYDGEGAIARDRGQHDRDSRTFPPARDRPRAVEPERTSLTASRRDMDQSPANESEPSAAFAHLSTSDCNETYSHRDIAEKLAALGPIIASLGQPSSPTSSAVESSGASCDGFSFNDEKKSSASIRKNDQSNGQASSALNLRKSTPENSPRHRGCISGIPRHHDRFEVAVKKPTRQPILSPGRQKEMGDCSSDTSVNQGEMGIGSGAALYTGSPRLGRSSCEKQALFSRASGTAARRKGKLTWRTDTPRNVATMHEIIPPTEAVSRQRKSPSRTRAGCREPRLATGSGLETHLSGRLTSDDFCGQKPPETREDSISYHLDGRQNIVEASEFAALTVDGNRATASTQAMDIEITSVFHGSNPRELVIPDAARDFSSLSLSEAISLLHHKVKARHVLAAKLLLQGEEQDHVEEKNGSR